MLQLIVIWVINALALLALPYVFSSIHVASFGTALLVALVLGLINTLLRPLLVLLTLPVTLLTLGLFIFVINAFLFQLADSLVSGFEVGGFWSALFGSISYSVISWALHALVFPQKSS